jgi:hypothetical protein
MGLVCCWMRAVMEHADLEALAFRSRDEGRPRVLRAVRFAQLPAVSAAPLIEVRHQPDGLHADGDDTLAG